MCLPTLCVCLVPGLCLLCETRAGVPAHCSCVCAPRALAESVVRDSLGCACPFVHASLFVSCLGWVYSVRLTGMCQPALRVCVCLVPGLSLLCEPRAGVPAHCSCVCAPRALAESIVRDAWGDACPFVHANLFVSCLGWVYSVRLTGMCQPALRVCVCLVSVLRLLCETRGDVPAHLCMRACSCRAWVGFTL